VLPHLDDIASDFSAFHHVDDITALPGPVFFRLAHRLGAYDGVMRLRSMMLAREQEPRPPQRTPAAAAPPQPRRRPPAGAVTPETLASEDALLGRIISFGAIGQAPPQPNASAPDQGAEDHRPDLREVAQRQYPELRAQKG
jgi:hypothetical protein